MKKQMKYYSETTEVGRGGTPSVPTVRNKKNNSCVMIMIMIMIIMIMIIMNNNVGA